MSDFLQVAQVTAAKQALDRLRAGMQASIKGKDDVIDQVLVCLVAGGHLLIEDLPGVGKTTLAYALARSMDCPFSRIQFTSDLLPGDVTGVAIYDETAKEFVFKKGPVFASVVLADEINRTTPKTQSALLEAMNEWQVTVDGRSHKLEPPFMVIATQNPVEHHGTYPLPESQLDRFLLRLHIGYPGAASEREIVRGLPSPEGQNQPVIMSVGEVLQLQAAASAVRVDDAIVDYMLAIVERTRQREALTLGVSPRGAQALYRATQALALVEGRDYAIPDDVKRLVLPAFSHRLVVNTRYAPVQRASVAASRILEEILTEVDVPL